MRRPFARGMTLLEVLFTAALSLIIMGAVMFLFGQGLRAWSEGQHRVTAQQSALLAMHRLTSDLQMSDVKSVRAYPDPSMSGRHGVSFLSALQDGQIQHDVYGEILWQKFSVYYLDESTRTIRYREEPIGTPVPNHPLGNPVRDPDPLQLSDGFHPDPNDHVVACNIAALSFNLVSGSNPVSLEIQADDEKRLSSLRAAVVMENGFLKAHSTNWKMVRLNPTLLTPPQNNPLPQATP